MTTTEEGPRRIGGGPVPDKTPEPIPDPDTAPTRADEVTSPLDALRNELKGDTVKPPLVLSVKSRNHTQLRYDLNVLTLDDIQAWRKRSRDKSKPDEFDVRKFACIVIANTCDAVLFRGQVVNGRDRKPLNFRHEELWEMVSAGRAVDAVTFFFGENEDARIMAHMNSVMSAAGYDELEADEADPT
jgi:hypothetical protein